jgi:hypothetical protein
MKKLVIVIAITALFICSCNKEKTKKSIDTSLDVKTIEIMVNFLPVSTSKEYFKDTNDSGKIINAVIDYNENGIFNGNLQNNITDRDWKERIRLLSEVLK